MAGGVGGHKTWSGVGKEQALKVTLWDLTSKTDLAHWNAPIMSVGFVALGTHLRKLYGVGAAVHNCSHMVFQKLECYNNQTHTYLHYLLAMHAQRTLTRIVRTYHWFAQDLYPCQKKQNGLQYIDMCAFVLFHTVTQSDLSLYKDILLR